jgi:hypothetical protein
MLFVAKVMDFLGSEGLLSLTQSHVHIHNRWLPLRQVQREKRDMGSKAREIKEQTIKRLYSLSGNRCTFPSCDQTFFKPDSNVNISEICHIEAAESGGPRYNPDSTDDYRRSYENLILLCRNHHKEADDDVSQYPVEILKEMKKKREDEVRKLFSQKDTRSRSSSALSRVVQCIGKSCFNDETIDRSMQAPIPEEKISYNQIIRYKDIIREYVVYQERLNQIYGEIEKQGSRTKELVLRNIHTLYLKEKGKYLSFKEVQAHADTIIETIEGKLWNMVNDSSSDMDLEPEAIDMSILIVLVDAFIRCEVMEEPKVLNS